MCVHDYQDHEIYKKTEIVNGTNSSGEDYKIWKYIFKRGDYYKNNRVTIYDCDEMFNAAWDTIEIDFVDE